MFGLRFFSREKGLGAIKSTPDNRHIRYAEVHTPVDISSLPKSVTVDITNIPVFNQMSLGTCVAHAFVVVKTHLDFKELGRVVSLSRRFLYTVTRKMFGYSNVEQHGLSPIHGVKALCKVGTTEDVGLDDNTISHAEYLSLPIDDAEMKKAEPYRAKGFTVLDLDDPSEIMQALVNKNLVPITLEVDRDTWFNSGFVRKVRKLAGLHYVVIYGYEVKNNDIIFKFRNSWGILWGKTGDGEFLWSEYDGNCFDAVTVEDLPNDLIERAKATRFIFNRPLSYGSVGDDVRELQKRLKEYGFFTYSSFTSFFGRFTKEAVQKFQTIKGLSPDGKVGTLTLKALNEDTSDSIKNKKSKIDLWCEAIAKMEKAKPELNNPGNIKYIGQKTAIGKDYRGFCIFPDYATGYMELRNLLVRACTGKSKVYSPEMTLIDFFNKYAPSNDGNDPDNYAKFVANYVGVSPQIIIKTLL
jgi:hypothetical protein